MGPLYLLAKDNMHDNKSIKVSVLFHNGARKRNAYDYSATLESFRGNIPDLIAVGDSVQWVGAAADFSVRSVSKGVCTKGTTSFAQAFMETAIYITV